MFPGNLNQGLSREALRVLAVVDVATIDFAWCQDWSSGLPFWRNNTYSCFSLVWVFFVVFFFLNIHSITFPTQNRTISETTTWIQKQSGIKALSNFYRQRIREMWRHSCWPAQCVSGVFIKVPHTERSRQAMKGGSANTDPREDGQESETETSGGEVGGQNWVL